MTVCLAQRLLSYAAVCLIVPEHSSQTFAELQQGGGTCVKHMWGLHVDPSAAVITGMLQTHWQAAALLRHPNMLRPHITQLPTREGMAPLPPLPLSSCAAIAALLLKL